MALGLTMPLLGALGILEAGAPSALAVMVLVTAVLTAASLNRWVLLGTLGAAAVLGAGWVVNLGGSAMVLEVARGIVLHMSGYRAVMPLIAGETAVLLSLVVSLCAFGLTSRHAGPLPGVMVVLLVLVMLWFRGEGVLVAWTMPALASALTMVAVAAHDDGAVWPVLPWAAAICCAACLVIPASGLTAEPLERFAEEVRQRIEDYLFYGTRTRTSFTLANEGYYTQGQTQMGGPAYPTDHPVMMVKAPRTVYLKGVSMNRYTGRMWENTVRGKQYLWVSPLHRDARDQAFDALLPSEGLRQSAVLAESQVTVTMVAPNVSSLFVPQRVRSLTVGGDLVPYYNDSGEVFVSRDLEAGDTYTVSAMLCMGGDAGLETIVDAASATGDRAYSEILQVYTALPEQFMNPLYETIQTQMYEKTLEAVGNAATPYQTALSIQNWLRANYRYELDVAPQNVDMDFAYSFLLGPEREGYCMHFASAMTVMCRMMGLPARYVEGYLAEPDSTGTAYVTGLNAHAWTEVYFQGFGWLTFDPTPSTHMGQGGQGSAPQSEPSPEPTTEPTAAPTTQPTTEPTASPSDRPEETPESDQLPEPPEQTPTPEPGAAGDDAPTDAPDDQPLEPESVQTPGQRGPWWWLLLLLAVLLMLVGRVVWTLPGMAAKRCRSDRNRWMVWAQAMHDTLRVLKRPKRAGESPLAYLRRLAAQGWAPELLDDEGELEALVFYGRHEPDADDVRLAQAAYLAVSGRLRPLKRAKLVLVRAFVPLKRRAFTR